ncbi:restriction endonuclease subunit S [Acinetobacter variabilis]|uniref:restriction endonuclease subunit S n=1 Tax=Acinetobacter variabilis TaxID=70346 RepID=UPI00289D4CCC|nr:restriction endonuclease subunit S [Acinetobacter variabilis]
MSEWQTRKIGNIAYLNISSLSKNHPYIDYLYLDTGSLTKGVISDLQFFSKSDLPSRAKRLVKSHDILYSLVRPNQEHYGYIEKPADNLVVSTGFAVITSKKEVVFPKFLFYWLTQKDQTEYLHSVAEGSTSAYPALKPQDIEILEIQIPPLPEQKAIASILSSLDDKIDLLHRQNKTLEAMAETLFRQWFIEEAKEDWEEVQLKELVFVIDNRGKTPPYLEEATYHPIIEVNALTKNGRAIDYSVIRKYVTKETFDTWFRQYLEPLDIVLSTVGSIGSFGMFFGGGGCVAQNIIGLRAQKKISNFFLYQWLVANTDEIKELDIGSVQPSIKVPHLLSLSVKIPMTEKLEKFDTQVEYWVRKILANTKQIQTLENLRDTLLPKLMSGEVRVQYQTETTA